MATILAVDDEQPILELIKNGLQKDGHMVTGYVSAEQVPLNHLNRYDLIILDIMMPGMDGFSFCEKIRSVVDCPILFLTAKTMENEITFGLGLGADDYLTKPFRIPELRARVNAHIRREQRERHSSLNFERIKIDLSAKTVQVDGEIVSLTSKANIGSVNFLPVIKDRCLHGNRFMRLFSVWTEKVIIPRLPLTLRISGRN